MAKSVRGHPHSGRYHPMDCRIAPITSRIRRLRSPIPSAHRKNYPAQQAAVSERVLPNGSPRWYFHLLGFRQSLWQLLVNRPVETTKCSCLRLACQTPIHYGLLSLTSYQNHSDSLLHLRLGFRISALIFFLQRADKPHDDVYVFLFYQFEAHLCISRNLLLRLACEGQICRLYPSILIEDRYCYGGCLSSCLYEALPCTSGNLLVRLGDEASACLLVSKLIGDN
mmetsp:Transcript_39342/g.86356  ORF Transcript_39342/g.86356 Transcript_39342/m.86356 type:complete len:225 (-) Transcript_39342:137-811(-)